MCTHPRARLPSALNIDYRDQGTLPGKKPESNFRRRTFHGLDEVTARNRAMQRAFALADTDGSGKLGRAELERACELWNVAPPAGGFGALLKECDVDGDGDISYEEFLEGIGAASLPEGRRVQYEQLPTGAVATAEAKINEHFSDMHRAFKLIDADGSGSVSTDELKRVLELWNISMAPAGAPLPTAPS